MMLILTPLAFYVSYLVIGVVILNYKEDPDEKYPSGDNCNLTEALQFLEENEILQFEAQVKNTDASWSYENNLTDYNLKLMLKAEQEFAEYSKNSWKETITFSWKDFKGADETSYRRFKMMSLLGTAALPKEKLEQMNQYTADMTGIYGKAKICPFNSTQQQACNLTLEPDIEEIITSSRDYEELKYVWVEWRNVSGKKMRQQFLNRVQLENEAARLNGFSDSGEFDLESFESPTFKADVEVLWQKIKPFYEQLHAYVRRRLRLKYPEHIKSDGPIPAHLLGNMWAQTWENIFDLLNPYPSKAIPDATPRMVEKGITQLNMFQISEEFFTSLGLSEMPQLFWNNTVMVKPTDREIVCHASAWDMVRKNDVRIKMCAEVNMEDLITIHHEMGHITYFLQYADQPLIFRTGANSGFHEAIGDVLALSASTPGHLKKIDLMKDVVEDDESDINFLLLMALKKIAFLPFGYLIDSYRWRVYSGEITSEDLNTKWWEMRLKYQGVCPPVVRTEADFDPAAKYHVAADVPYIRYFVSFIIQFQFHKSLCKAAEHQGPLHKCDIYQNRDAGSLLSEMLKLGGSLKWPKAMELITEGETDKMDVGPLLEYFDPLMKWLKKENEGEYIGWKSDKINICP